MSGTPGTMEKRRWTRRALALLASAFVGLAAVAPAAVAGPSQSIAAQSAPAEVSEWDASYQNSSAAGTAEVTPYGIVEKTVTIEGDVTSSKANECYRVQVWAQHDFVGIVHDIIDHCGTGSTAFVTEHRGMMVTSSFGVRLCRISHEGAEAPTSCGNISWI